MLRDMTHLASSRLFLAFFFRFFVILGNYVLTGSALRHGFQAVPGVAPGKGVPAVQFLVGPV